jgi:hypothetical protein
MPIILKRGTEANRVSLSLKTGEPIFTTDTRRVYIGSGSASTGNEIEFGQLSASFVSASVVSASSMNVGSLSATTITGVIESASYVEYSNVANKPALVSSSVQFGSTDNVIFGQITASSIQVETMHIQTVTSSIAYVSGSTIHGSVSTDTHQFTGSVSISGSLTLNSVGSGLLSANAGGTITPRTITGTANQVIVANGDGVSGNPTLSLPQSIATGSTPTFASMTLAPGSGQYPTGLTIQASTHATSRRAGFALGNWMAMQDPSGNGTQSFALYDTAASATRLSIDTVGNVGIGIAAPKAPLHVLNADNVVARFDSTTVGAYLQFGAVKSAINVIGEMAWEAYAANSGALHYGGNASTRHEWQSNAYDVIMDLSAMGALRLNKYGAGTLITDSSGNVTALAGQQNVSTTSTPQFASVFARGVTAAGAGTLEAQSSDYSSTYCSTTVSQFGSTATGTACGIAQASAGVVQFRNTSAGIIYTNGPAPLVLGTNNTDRLHIAAAGNVGIGTISPAVKLEVAGDGSDNSLKAGISVVDTGTNGRRFVMASRASTFTISDETSAISRVVIKSTGALQFVAYGAGTLVTDSSGNITATSDARMKNVSGSFDRGLDAIVNLSPKVYRWNEASGLNTDDVNVGLIAQEVLPYIPEAVSEKDGRYTMSDRPIIAALINAVKELKADNDALRKRIEALEA